jgi:hypothetical protein
VTVPPAAGPLTALTVGGAAARVDVPLLHSAAVGATTVTASSVASDTIDGGQMTASSLSMALPPGTAASRIVHVEGGEIHSGGGSEVSSCGAGP